MTRVYIPHKFHFRAPPDQMLRRAVLARRIQTPAGEPEQGGKWAWEWFAWTGSLMFTIGVAYRSMRRSWDNEED